MFSLLQKKQQHKMRVNLNRIISNRIRVISMSLNLQPCDFWSLCLENLQQIFMLRLHNRVCVLQINKLFSFL